MYKGSLYSGSEWIVVFYVACDFFLSRSSRAEELQKKKVLRLVHCTKHLPYIVCVYPHLGYWCVYVALVVVSGTTTGYRLVSTLLTACITAQNLLCRSFVTAELVSLSLSLSRMKNQHGGHWVCWMPTGYIEMTVS